MIRYLNAVKEIVVVVRADQEQDQGGLPWGAVHREDVHPHAIYPRQIRGGTGGTISTKQPTVGIDFMAKNIHVGHNILRMQLWDTAGQERFRSLIPSYLKDALIAFIVFDLTSTLHYNQRLEILRKPQLVARPLPQQQEGQDHHRPPRQQVRPP